MSDTLVFVVALVAFCTAEGKALHTWSNGFDEDARKNAKLTGYFYPVLAVAIFEIYNFVPTVASADPDGNVRKGLAMLFLILAVIVFVINTRFVRPYRKTRR